MLFKAGVLDASPDVRSVPLSAKRRRGRPKRLPNCLAMSPVSAQEVEVEEELIENPVVEEEVEAEEVLEEVEAEEVLEEVEEVEEVDEVDERRTRKRKAGLKSSKPPKKKAKLPASVASSSIPVASSSKSSSDVSHPKPVAKNCKKKKGSCSHEIVFEKHYDKKEWKSYADRVRSAKAITTIDPD